MKKKGFTLIELLGVIIVLSLVATVVVISVSKTLDDSKTKLTEVQIKKVKEAARQYYIEQDQEELEVGNSLCVDINTLIDKGYFNSSEIKDFTTDDDIIGSIEINRVSDEKYTYEYSDESCPS